MAQLLAQHPDSAKLEGDLTLKTVAGLLPQGVQLIQQAQQQWQLDMSAVGEVSSAGAALLVEWLKAAQQRKLPFFIVHLPEKLIPILEISDLTLLFAPLLRASE